MAQFDASTLDDGAPVEQGDARSDGRREARRTAIIDIAREAFLEDGYVGTSMSTISVRLGGSKATLYAYFRSKEELFIAVVEEMTDRHGSAIRSRITPGEPPASVLTAVGRQALQVMTSTEPLKLHRLVTAEAERFPQLGKALYDRSSKLCYLPLSHYLAGAAQAGQLRAHDSDLAARQFIGLCRARSFEPTTWNLRSPLSPVEIETHVSEAVVTFMAAYGPR